MSFGRKGEGMPRARPRSPERPTNIAQVVGTPALSAKRNRVFGSTLFFVAAFIVGAFGFWADRQVNFYYDQGIPVVGEVVGSRTTTSGSGSSRQVTRLDELRAAHPVFGTVSLELARPGTPAALPDGSAADDRRVLVLLHPTDPAAGRIASAEGPVSPVIVTTIMAIGFFLFALANLFTERRLIGSRKTRLRKD